MSDTPAAARWRKLISEYAATGLSPTEFALQHDVKPGTFNWWRWRLKKLDAERPPFTELIVVAPKVPAPIVCDPTPEPTVVVTFDHLPAHIVVDQETDLPLLQRVLVALC